MKNNGAGKDRGLYFFQFQKIQLILGSAFVESWKWLFSIPYPEQSSLEYKKFFNLQNTRDKNVSS